MIEWISVNDETPKMHEEKDDDGRIYHVSNIILCWDGDEEEPFCNHCGTKLHWFDNEKENRDGQ